MSQIIQEVRSLIHSNYTSGTGWTNMNCRFCGDKRRRGGIKFEHDSFVYSCFNGGCEYNIKPLGWKFGYAFGQRQRAWFERMGGDINSLPPKERMGSLTPTTEKKSYGGFITHFPTIDVPPKVDFLPWNNNPVAQYLRNKLMVDDPDILLPGERFEDIDPLGGYPVLYYPGDYTRYVLPFFHKDEIVGYIERDITKRKGERRMRGRVPPQFMVKQDTVFEEGKFVIVVESALDAIAFGVRVPIIATRSNRLSKPQINLLKACNKEVVFVPDYKRSEAQGFINVVKEHNNKKEGKDWWLSAPLANEKYINDIGDVMKQESNLLTIRIHAVKRKDLLLL